jgi:hypothetical protein
MNVTAAEIIETRTNNRSPTCAARTVLVTSPPRATSATVEIETIRIQNRLAVLSDELLVATILSCPEKCGSCHGVK